MALADTLLLFITQNWRRGISLFVLTISSLNVAFGKGSSYAILLLLLLLLLLLASKASETLTGYVNRDIYAVHVPFMSFDF